MPPRAAGADPLRDLDLRHLPGPVAIDLFCGGGGAGYGLRKAGYKTVIGVDIDDHPNYAQLRGMRFVRGDVLNIRPESLMHADLVWASPPCQAHSSIVPAAQRRQFEERWRAKGRHIDLIPATRNLLRRAGVKYIIENVDGAKGSLRNPIRMCGTMFDDLDLKSLPKGRMLKTFRPRLFEFWLGNGNVPKLHPPEPTCRSKGASNGLRGKSNYHIRLPQKEKMIGGRSDTPPSGFRVVEKRFPSREDGRVDHIYVPTTPTRRAQVQAALGRPYARSMLEVNRSVGYLVPMTAREIKADMRRYQDELAGRTKPPAAGGSQGRRPAPPAGQPAREMFPIYGSDKARGTNEQWADALGGTTWMSRNELRESIPPAYAEYLARQVLATA